MIRNCITHNGAALEYNDDPGSNYVKVKPFIAANADAFKLTARDDIVIEDALIDRAIERSRTSLATIHAGAEALYP